MWARLERLAWRFAPVSLYLALRSWSGRQGVSTLVTTVAIATSVVLATATQTASNNVHQELQRTAQRLSGVAQLRIDAGDAGISERDLELARQVPGVRHVSPMIESSITLLDGERIYVVGLDFLEERDIREYTMLEAGLEVRDPLRLVATGNSIVLSEALVQRLGVDEGDAISVRAVGSKRELRELVVQGTLAREGLGEVFGGLVALMDIFALQGLEGRGATFDRAHIVVEESSDLEAMRERVQRSLGGGTRVSLDARSEPWADRVIDALSVAVGMVTAIGFFVAMFISYSALSLSVERRIPELELFRTIGVLPADVRTILLMDGLAAGTGGAAVGVPVGVFASGWFLSFFSRFADLQEFTELQVVSASLDWTSLVLGLLIGPCVGVTAAWWASHGALARAGTPVRSRERKRGEVRLFLAGALLLVGFFALGGRFIRVALLAGGTLSLSLAVLRLVPWRKLGAILDWVVPRVSDIVAGTLGARRNQTALAVVSVMAIVGGGTASTTVIYSLAQTFDATMRLQYSGLIRVRAGSPLLSQSVELSEETIRRIATASLVDGISRRYFTSAVVAGEETVIVGVDWERPFKEGRMRLRESLGDPKSALESGVLANPLLVSRLGIELGEFFQIRTQGGLARVRLSGTVDGFMSSDHMVVMAARRFRSLWPAVGASDMLVWPAGDVEQTVESARTAAGDDGVPVFFIRGPDLEAIAGQFLSRQANLTLALAMVGGAIGLMAVFNLMLGSVIARRREFQILNAAGAEPVQLATAVFADAAVVGLVGAVLGTAVGIGWSAPLGVAISEQLGWRIDFYVSFAAVAVAWAFAAFAALGAAALALPFVRSPRPMVGLDVE